MKPLAAAVRESAGPNAIVWASVVFGDIENVTVVPTGTDFVAGKNPRIVDLSVSLPAETALPGGPANLPSFFSRLTTLAYSFLAAFAFALLEGIALALPTTLTVP